MDIEAWLQGLGLERYAPAFRDNEIDWEVLPKLTSEDLREIGVAAVGHRRKLLGAIAALGTSGPTATVTAAVSGASTPADAERRQLTVMFCDLVGSTPLNQDSALYPFITQLEHGASFARNDTVEEKLGKLRQFSSGAATDDEIELLAELLSLPNSAAELNLSPQRKREMLFEALLHQLEVLAESRPVLMVFEDAHWIDPTSRELLDLTLDRVHRLPVLLIVTFRPEFQHGRSGQPYVTMLALNRLGKHDVTALVRGLSGNAPLGSDIVEEIVERTDGVPLFIEELTRAVLERAGEDRRVTAVLSVSPVPALAVPATLHASLIARLDRIGAAAKEVAQIGAVIGREFFYELIEPVAQCSRTELRAALARLTETGLLFCRGVAPQSSYLFKHALVQDAAYGTLLRGRRQELHARVAAALEQHLADLVERQPELLAHHLTAASDTERAVDQWLKAGQYAAERSAHREAISHFERGLAALGALPRTQGRDRREVELQLARGISLLTAKGFNSSEAVEPFARARDLCEKSGDADRLFVASWNVWLTTISSPDAAHPNAARALSDRLLTLARTHPNSTLLLEAHHSAWATRFSGGEPSAARGHCEEGRRLYDFDRHRSLATMYGGHDPGCCACQFASWSEWLLGYPDTAIESINEGQRLAERLAVPLVLNQNLLFEAVLRVSRGESELALCRAREARAHAIDQRLAPLLDPDILAAGALAGQSAVVDALSLIREKERHASRARGRLRAPSNGRGGRGAVLRRRLRRRGRSARRGRSGHRRGRGALVGGGNSSPEGPVVAVPASARRERGLLRACNRDCAATTGKIARVARRDEPCAVVERTRPAGRSARAAGAGVRLVHRGLRHRRSESSEGAAR